jgi:hypothetical protein
MQIFISHSSKDLEWVELLAKRIEAAGANAYLAQLDHSGVGHDLNQKLCDAIDASDVFVVLLTDNAAATPLVREEIGYARGKNKRVIPLVTREVAGNPAALGMLNGVEHIPFDREDAHAGLIELTDVLYQIAQEEREASYRAETEALSQKLVAQSQALTRMQARSDAAFALAILAGALLFVVAMNQPSNG